MAYHGHMCLLAVYLLTLVAAFDKSRFPGPYCKTRVPEQCCPNRDDKCTVPIHDTLCYCDQFCGEHSVEDCCPDFFDTCTQPTRAPTENQCIKEGKYYQLGDQIKIGCNSCKCTKSGVASNVQSWQCAREVCINEQELVSRINAGRHGWAATTYAKFDGVSLKDGPKYFLGTIKPKREVSSLNPLNISPDKTFEREFDAREAWPNGYIHAAMDQGMCASSWAFSTASVAADRWSIQSQGKFLDQMSTQSMLSCNRFVKGCDGGRIEDAYWYLQIEGVVAERCYPYTSGTTREKGKCKYIEDIVCPNNEEAHVHKTTPPYRIAPDERQIMEEIKTQGPVQAIITVWPDFYLYERGIYQHSQEEVKKSKSDHTISGTHSVKIIGWGEENGVKYWRCVNSWGTRWGEDGMFRIRRGVNESGIEEFVLGVWASVEKHDLHDNYRSIKLN